MSFVYNDKNKQFHLYNEEISYIFYAMSTGVLGHIYFGKRLPTDRDYTYQKTKMNQVLKVYTDDKSLISYDDTLQEIPVYGRGDYREEAINITYDDGSSLNDFVYKSHEVKNGVFHKELGGLPRSKVQNEKDVTTLKVVLSDEYRNVDVELYYTIFEKIPVITRYIRVVNNSKKEYKINKCASLNLDFNESNYKLMQLDGSWSRERYVNIRDLSMGKTSFGSLKGSSSPTHNPFFALIKEGANEDNGDVYGINLVYSGNFEASVEVNTFLQMRAQIGIHQNGFMWNLAGGMDFFTPEAVMAYSGEGLNGLSHIQHRFITDYILPKDVRKEPQVLLNNWEATYYDFDENKLKDIANSAKELGVNLFVLDDGWFVGRDSDTAALGDWFVDEKKLPSGIKTLSDYIHSIGMDFGLWIEPEMTNLKSKLYEEHPDWVIGHNNYFHSVGRHQHVLDFSNPDVVDCIYRRISAIFRESDIDYVKWDMNRYISEPNSKHLDAKHQGEFSHRYILGVYDLYRRLTGEFPNITFESCASGGGRFDLGMLCYSIQTWTSDDTDPVERLKIQTGTSYAYPIRCMGSHVSAKVNHQTLRETSLKYKSHVALFGTYGLELDSTQMTEEDKIIIKEQVKFFKENKELIHNGRFIRLETPFNPTGANHNDLVSWMVVSEDKKDAIIGVYQTLAKPAPNAQRLYLKGLDKNTEYEVKDIGRAYSGIELIEMGFVMDEFFTGIFSDVDDTKVHIGKRFGHGDFTSKIIVLTAKEK